MPDIVVASTNDNVHCNVCGVKTTIKKVGFLSASIAPTIGDHVFFTIEGMSEANFLIWPRPKQVQLLIKT